MQSSESATVSQPIHLDAYFDRIGYMGNRQPTLDTLRALHLLHAQTIPFENLSPLLGMPLLLTPAALEKKLVHDRRGGYCFEHNLLLLNVLTQLGYQAVGLKARVMWTHPDHVVTPRTHMLLRVTIEGADYIADVGFGGQTLTGPLRLEVDTEQTTPHEPYRLIHTGSNYVLQSRIRGEWKSNYRFDLQEQHQVDYEVANWYVATHPESLFVSNLLAARPTTDRRYALLNNHLAIHHLNGETEKRTLSSVDELRETLESLFHIPVPAGTNVNERLATLFKETT